MVKKAIRIVTLLLISALAAGCGNDSRLTFEEGKVNVVASFYPLYDFSTKIGGGHAHVVNMIPAGVEPHDWSPKPQDMKNITKADVFVYNGGGFEGWVDDFLGGLDAEELVVVEAIHEVDLISAGHEEDEGEHSHDEAEEAHAEEDDHGHSHDGADPHAWLSPKQALAMAEAIYEGFVEADPEHEADYAANYGELQAQLIELDRSYAETIAAAPRKQIVVSHEAYAYLARDYGLEQLGVMGISPESEPTAQDMKRIADFVKEHGVQYILFEELASPELAETLAADLGIETLVFHPLEGLTEEQERAGEDYVSIMKANLSALKLALQ